MATSPLRGFTDLSRYQQAAVQPQANVLDQFIQALNQGVSLAQLPQTIQRENQLQQQQLILGNLKAAIAQQQLDDLKNPRAAIAREMERNLAIQSFDPRTGVVPLSTDQLTPEQLSIFEGGVSLARPGTITPEQQNLLRARDAGVQAGGIPLELPTAPLRTPIVPRLGLEGSTQFGRDIEGQTEALTQDAALQQIIDAPKVAAEVAKINARNKGQEDLLTRKLTGQTEKQRQDFVNKLKELKEKHDFAVTENDTKQVAKFKNDMALLREKNSSTSLSGKIPALAKERLSSIRSQRSALSGTLTQSTLPKQEISIRDEIRRLDALENSILDSLEVPIVEVEPAVPIRDRAAPAQEAQKEKISKAQAKSVFDVLIKRGFSSQEALDRINDTYESE